MKQIVPTEIYAMLFLIVCTEIAVQALWAFCWFRRSQQPEPRQVMNRAVRHQYIRNSW